MWYTLGVEVPRKVIKMKKNVLEKIKNKMIVSCQGYDERTFHTAEDMLAMANAANLGGCVGFRLNSPEYVSLVRKHFPNQVIIGIWKQEHENSEVYITPDVQSILALKEAGADIIAIDSTNRKNYLGDYGWETIIKAKKIDPSLVIMADCASYEDAKKACNAGADIVSTTMSGYTDYSDAKDGPDYDMLKKCRDNLSCFILCEGRIWTREDAKKCFECGADSIVIGTSITNPKMITERFVNYLKEEKIWRF